MCTKLCGWRASILPRKHCFIVLLLCVPASSFAPSALVVQQRCSRTLSTLVTPIIQFASTQEDVSFLKNQGTDDETEVPVRVRFNRRSPVTLYTEYASRLWLETNLEARQKIASDRTAILIHQLQHVLKEDDVYSAGSKSARQNVIDACDIYLREHQHEQNYKIVGLDTTQFSTTLPVPTKPPVVKKNRRSVMFGVVMGAAVACWVFSGSYIFTALFTLMTILGQLEYYRMIINTGIYPARRISVVGACSMFLTALFTPNLHQICLPLFGLYAMVWFLTMKRSVTTISEIATTFTGMFYLGYVPSFWVRTRLINNRIVPTLASAAASASATTVASLPATRELTRLAPVAAPLLGWIQKVSHQWFPTLSLAFHVPITSGSIFIFWTWLSIAFSDVAAYFVGKNFGKTKLGAVAPAAGATSPNKTVEGVLGGCAISAALSILGAWVQKWPFPIVTGGIHGFLLGLIGLIGDLTASMLKRDAGLKDFGDFLPEHGGILDRVDSFVWAAPYSWLVCAYVIPALKLRFS